MRKPTFTHSLILTAALLIGAGPYIVRAAGPAPEGPAVANIDFRQVYNASEARKTAEMKSAEFGRLLGQRFDEVAALGFIAPAEAREISEIVTVEKMSDEGLKKLAAIREAAAKRGEELVKLSSKKDAELTDADRSRIRELNQIRQQHAQIMPQLQRLFQQVMDEQDAVHNAAGMAQVRDIVTKLAREKGITQVFDTSSLIVAPVDLTQPALQRVEAKKK